MTIRWSLLWSDNERLRSPSNPEALQLAKLRSAQETGRLLVSQLKSAGVQPIQLDFTPLKPTSVACVIDAK